MVFQDHYPRGCEVQIKNTKLAPLVFVSTIVQDSMQPGESELEMVQQLVQPSERFDLLQTETIAFLECWDYQTVLASMLRLTLKKSRQAYLRVTFNPSLTVALELKVATPS